ncbi:TPA: hypothetical protein MD369_004140, partial [Klebsiella pneumoniae]|nr:hypothetical protein [Klebsiella pneumoniae]HBY5439110.1 hypothetical protein [Klebsiella pneumoniae]HED2370539.1 hypothetical protein [Klebsiella pneumoniae]
MNISELTRWDDHIYLIARNDRVEGGTSGVANTQAKQLANRTRWLKTLIESAEDYREYTFYKSEQDPDGTISGRANTPEGKIFRVTQSINDTLAFIYYLNYQGQAIPLTALLGRGSITNNIRQYPSLPIAQHDIEAGNILDGSKFYITNPDNDILVDEFVNNGGAPEATGRIVLDGSLLKPLTDAVIYSESDEFSRSGYLSAVISSDRFIINAVRYDGSFYVPELKAPGLNVDELNSIVHELKFLDPVEFLRSGYLSAVLSADRYILSAVALDSDVYIPVISDSVG